MLVGKLQAEEIDGSNHVKYKIRYEGRLVANTVLSRSYAELSRGMESKIASQLHVSNQQFYELIRCTMSREEYIRHLLDQNE